MKKRINSRAKGARGEREFAQKLREAGHAARRGQQFSGSNESPDVVSSLPFHFEVKRVEKFNIYKAMEQAVRDAESGKPPVVVHKRNGSEWFAVLRLEDFLSLVTTSDSGAKPLRRIRRVS